MRHSLWQTEQLHARDKKLSKEVKRRFHHRILQLVVTDVLKLNRKTYLIKSFWTHGKTQWLCASGYYSPWPELAKRTTEKPEKLKLGSSTQIKTKDSGSFFCFWRDPDTLTMCRMSCIVYTVFFFLKNGYLYGFLYEFCNQLDYPRLCC